MIYDIDPELTVDEHIEALRKLADWAEIPSPEVETVVVKVRARMAELEDLAEKGKVPTFEAKSPDEGEDFDDAALRDLFASLVER
jgi:hypothetical protein